MKHRDLTVIDLPGGTKVLIACDALGGIGPKEHDAVPAEAHVVGRFGARVALMEVIAAGGRPVALVDNCCVEPDPTGAEILRGIRDEAALAGLGSDQITGSFEKNVPTCQTGLGITALAISERELPRALPGDLIVAVGLPKVGPEVALSDGEIADLPLAIGLAQNPDVHDLLPVGSRGIAAEAAEIAATAGLPIELLPPEAGWDLAKSAGPATCCLAAIAPAVLPALALTLDRPWAVVARISVE
ncbi:MAG TPA: AIR synthase related protein [Symbiobacteriaceae bacterium]|nr:AIR synthase related protein [Symbiobacteriaceae bacterium]